MQDEKTQRGTVHTARRGEVLGESAAFSAAMTHCAVWQSPEAFPASAGGPLIGVGSVTMAPVGCWCYSLTGTLPQACEGSPGGDVRRQPHVRARTFWPLRRSTRRRAPCALSAAIAPCVTSHPCAGPELGTRRKLHVPGRRPQGRAMAAKMLVAPACRGRARAAASITRTAGSAHPGGGQAGPRSDGGEDAEKTGRAKKEAARRAGNSADVKHGGPGRLRAQSAAGRQRVVGCARR